MSFTIHVDVCYLYSHVIFEGHEFELVLSPVDRFRVITVCMHSTVCGYKHGTAIFDRYRLIERQFTVVE